MLFCFGYGYVAQCIGGIGTSRSPRGQGQFLYAGGPFSKEILDALHNVNYVLISIPPQDGEDSVISSVTKTLSSFRHLKWIGYLSSTSVYGDHKGNWVDETSETNPSSSQGKARLNAEHQWLSLANSTGLPVHIFRLAGIYGPGRNVLKDLSSGKAQRIIKDDVVFSRIHVADIAQVLKASMKTPHPGRIYNVADNLPAPSHEVIAYGAELLRMDPPPLIPFEDAHLTPMGQSFYLESKRVRNQRILSELIPSLLYPTYKEGLRSLLTTPQT